MRVTTHALFVCALFLSRLEERVLGQREYCAGNRCFAVVPEPVDFPGAQKICKLRGGELMALPSLEAQEMVTLLLSGLAGRFWLGLRLPDGRCPDLSSQQLGYRWTTGDGASDYQNWGTADANCSSKCASVFAERNLTWWQESCHDELTGLLCQYTIEGDTCSGFQVGGGAQVTYTTPMGTHGESLASFPPGTIAVKENAGVEYPDSTFICYGGWLRAPWSCEVNNGGCEHSCVSPNQKPLCACPAGQTLRANNITCAKDPCAECAHQCHRDGGISVCRCNEGYRLAQDKKGCVDVNECEEEEDPCTAEKNEMCLNTAGGFLCVCRDGFVEEDGECVDVSICGDCEHMDCQKSDGVYVCVCRPGFRVSERDPTKCEKHCGEQDCLATCIPNPDSEQQDASFCDCPDGYIKDVRNNTLICTDINECDEDRTCDHHCVNSFGSYWCLCDEGFELQKGHTCIPTDEEEGSGSTPPHPTSTPAANAEPAAVPSYVKTGSVLGIAVFLTLCMVLLSFAVRYALKRCRSFELTTLKREMDIFYLQQVTTERYKRFSFDKQSKSDSQRL